MGSAFTIFWIVAVVVLSLDFIGAIALCVMENKLKKQRPDNAEALDIENATTHIQGEDIYLHIAGGVVTVIDELPSVEVLKEVVKVVKEKVKGDEVVEEVVEEQPASYEDATEGEVELDAEGRVVFIASEHKQTYLDKLAALDKKDYALYEQLVNYLLSKDNVKQATTSNKSIFKYKTDRLVISSVRRGVVTLQFMLLNPSLERYMRAEGAKQIKITPVTIRLTDEDSLERAKGTADLTIEYLEQERQYNAEQKKAARREARRQKAEAERAAAAAADNTDGTK